MNVFLGSTTDVKPLMSTPAALNALKALAVEVLIAGNTTALEATISWQSADPRDHDLLQPGLRPHRLG